MQSCLDSPRHLLLFAAPTEGCSECRRVTWSDTERQPYFEQPCSLSSFGETKGPSNRRFVRGRTTQSRANLAEPTCLIRIEEEMENSKHEGLGNPEWEGVGKRKSYLQVPSKRPTGGDPGQESAKAPEITGHRSEAKTRDANES